MRIILFSRPDFDHNPDELRMLFALFSKYGLDYTVNRPFAERIGKCHGIAIPDSKRYSEIPSVTARESMVISYGGDGTFLEAVRLLDGTAIPILGINSGHLGFLANIPRAGISEALDAIVRKRYTIDSRSLLHVEGKFSDRVSGSLCAFNEFAIQRRGANMIYVDVDVDGKRVATYRGDGVLLSTPTGSTA